MGVTGQPRSQFSIMHHHSESSAGFLQKNGAARAGTCFSFRPVTSDLVASAAEPAPLKASRVKVVGTAMVGSACC